MGDDWRTLMEKAAAVRASHDSLTDKQREELDRVNKRAEAIQRGVKAVDGVTFAKKAKG